ncbi:hypothetical protein [Streptomyces naphthomycinicus]|uniref:hypothetical protein n=1 Tax=Streptomyces naphthomycinicus TaxID=2872625 RepID=UPI001CEDD69C|nr:hypothetical protein [Streptomyces sp. TML10]
MHRLLTRLLVVIGMLGALLGGVVTATTATTAHARDLSTHIVNIKTGGSLLPHNWGDGFQDGWVHYVWDRGQTLGADQWEFEPVAGLFARVDVPTAWSAAARAALRTGVASGVPAAVRPGAGLIPWGPQRVEGDAAPGLGPGRGITFHGYSPCPRRVPRAGARMRSRTGGDLTRSSGRRREPVRTGTRTRSRRGPS